MENKDFFDVGMPQDVNQLCDCGDCNIPKINFFKWQHSLKGKVPFVDEWADLISQSDQNLK